MHVGRRFSGKCGDVHRIPLLNNRFPLETSLIFPRKIAFLIGNSFFLNKGVVVVVASLLKTAQRETMETPHKAVYVWFLFGEFGRREDMGGLSSLFD